MRWRYSLRLVRHGQFPLQLSVYIRDDALARRADDFEEAVRLTGRLCALLGSACLLTDDSESFETDLLLQPNGEMLRVTLDEDCLLCGEFVITSSEPLGSIPPTGGAGSITRSTHSAPAT